MSTPAPRRAARLFAAATAFFVIGGFAAAPALAQETEPPASETVTPPTSEQAPVPETPAETPAPAPAPALAAPADLALTASADPGPFLVGQEIQLHVTITNQGGTAATKVHASASTQSGSSTLLPLSGWEDLAPVGPDGQPTPGGTIEPGASRKLTIVASVSKLDKGDPVIQFSLTSDPADVNLGNNQATLTLPMVPPTVTGDAGGVVFGDANENGKADRGEGLAGVVVTLTAGTDAPIDTMTDADGRFDFTGLPAQVYRLSFPGEQDGWILASTTRTVAVDGSDSNLDLFVRGVHPLRDVLDAKIDFGAKSYKPGEVAELTVTLTNHGSKALSGIHAGCDRFGSNQHIIGWGDVARWGDLAPSGHGVTVEAGDTKAFPVTGVVPDATYDFGVVTVACGFGDDNNYVSGFPTASAHAKVPGKTIDSVGLVYYDRNGNSTFDEGEAVANTKIALPDSDDGTIVAEASTDEGGKVRFTGVQVGWYHPVVYGPWQAAEPDIFVQIPNRFSETGDWEFRVKPGPDNSQPTTPAPPAGSSGGSGSGLAYTGVEVFGPLVGGTAAVFAGILALLFARRLGRQRG